METSLEKLGAVRPETREAHDGWALPLLPSTASSSEGRQQHGSESGSPDDIEGDASGRPDDRVRQTGRPEGPQSGGADETVRRAGRDWTAVAFWDRSVDRRGACNSAFIVHGDLTFAQVIRAARQVWARFTFPVVEVDERGMEVPR